VALPWILPRTESYAGRKPRSLSRPKYTELPAQSDEVNEKETTMDLTFKIGGKGGVSVYGLGRFPVTLYYEQWKRLLAASNELIAFLEQNKSRLKMKSE
jgi:hypothetical protein